MYNLSDILTQNYYIQIYVFQAEQGLVSTWSRGYFLESLDAHRNAHGTPIWRVRRAFKVFFNLEKLFRVQLRHGVARQFPVCETNASKIIKLK